MDVADEFGLINFIVIIQDYTCENSQLCSVTCFCLSVFPYSAMGISRSTSVTVAFLMYRDKITRDKALDLIKETRPYAR